MNSGTSKRAAFYRESFDFGLASKEQGPRKYLALYQTEFEECLRTKNYSDNVRHGSNLFPRKFDTSDNGDFDARYYQLLVDYDPKKTGECMYWL